MLYVAFNAVAGNGSAPTSPLDGNSWAAYFPYVVQEFLEDSYSLGLTGEMTKEEVPEGAPSVFADALIKLAIKIRLGFSL